MAGELLNARELGELLGLNEDTVYKKARRGEIPGLRIGRALRFHRSVIEAWLKGQPPPGESVFPLLDRSARVNRPSAADAAEPRPQGIGNGRLTVTTCGGLRRASSRSVFYHGR